MLAEIPDDGEEETKNKSLFNFTSGFTKDELVVLVSVLSGFSKSDFYVKLYSLFGKESVLFLSMFNGNAVKIPDIRYLLKLKKFSEIYLYLREYKCCGRAYCQVKEELRQKRIKELQDRIDNPELDPSVQELRERLTKSGGSSEILEEIAVRVRGMREERRSLIDSFDTAPCDHSGFCSSGYVSASKKFKKSEEDLKRITSKVSACMKQFKELFNVE